MCRFKKVLLRGHGRFQFFVRDGDGGAKNNKWEVQNLKWF
jgi:hypothetical protein